MATIKIGYEDWTIPSQAALEAADSTKLGYVLLRALASHGNKEAVVDPKYLGAAQDGSTDDALSLAAAATLSAAVSLPLLLGGVVVPAPKAVAVDAATIISHGGARVLLMTAASAADMSANPNLRAGIKVGQRVLLINVGSNAITFHDESNDGGTLMQLSSAVSVALGANDSIEVEWDGTYWVQTGALNVA